MMGYDIPHALHFFPFYGRIQRQQLIVGHLVQILKTLTNSL